MRGQGSIVIAVAFFSVILLVVIPLTLYVYYSSASRTPIYEDSMYRVVEQSAKVVSGDIIAFFNASSSMLKLVNRGGNRVEFERVVLLTTCGSTGHYLNLNRSIKLESGQQALLNIGIPRNLCENPRIEAVYMVTIEGVVVSGTVITIDELRGAVYVNTTVPTAVSRTIPILPVVVGSTDTIWNISVLERKGFEISTIDSMDRPTRILRYPQLARSEGMKGGTTPTSIWILDRVRNSITVSADDQSVRSLWIGYDPRNNSRYNLIITADSISIKLGSENASCTSFARVKIYGFRSVYTQGILRLNTGSTTTWITKPEQDIAEYTFLSNTRLTLSGSADRVEVYCRRTGSESSYNPYTMLMNTAGGRNHAGLLFTSIDRIWGNSSSRNEGDNQLLDYSVKPLALVYRGFSISNANYSSVVISINYRFHDNEGNDAEGTSIDKPVMIVGLVDGSGAVYSYRSYNYRELTRYEDTYPPTAQAQSSLFFTPLPPREVGEKKFYIFIAFQDPYHYNSYLDDLDFTLYIESVAIMLLT